MLQTLQSFINQHGTERSYWVAFSGGLDSRVLLELCVELRKQMPFHLKAVHVHHGLSAHADGWLQACEDICKDVKVDFQHIHIDAKPQAGESVEEFAREQRYQLLMQMLPPGDMLLTAHHQDDQAETVLLQLVRGAGLKGLSAMPAVKEFGLGLHGRPLLDFGREALRAYAETAGLSWVDDDLNAETEYSRNYFRHDVIPILKKRWPGVAAAMTRTAVHCAEAQALLTSFAAEDFEGVKGETPDTLSVKHLLELPVARQKLVLRFWMEQKGVSLPSAVKLQQMLETVLKARWDGKPCVRWGEVEVRRYQNELYLLTPAQPHEKKKQYSWNFQGPLFIAGVGELSAKPATTGLSTIFAEATVRFRQGGETYRLPNGQHHELKKFFQERKIPLWLRDRLPLIYISDELAAIPGYLVVERFKAQEGRAGFELSLTLL